MNIRDAGVADAAAIVAIYNHYILTTSVSFEEQSVSEDAMAGRIAGLQEAGLPFLAMTEGDTVIGYAYASKWRVRHAYRFAVESSIYLVPGLGGKGRGSALYQALLARLAQGGIHMVIGGVALPNEASVALHEKLGFRKVAHFSEVGFKFGRWIDVAYWELKLAGA
ncbi:N-acetyltransferase family protein [Massilia sp. P8910]|uniref:arsinothricin resistance N-acetyltransferase ArsN1 family B n=1 Tax=Massilia antarctica TaxID=2765360 RepID=UPI001E2DEA64|nr:arsinothricin resistance N-acetyltransferase ArsN1 family B [Massilia antarctica]MCE3608203.1 N-acetyltransferase family protein [Massilia antarctica]